MNHLLEAVADVTGTRDRETMDLSIVQVLEDALALSSVRLFRINQEDDGQHIAPRLAGAPREAELDLAWEASEAAEVRRTCLASAEIVRAAGPAGHLTVFPLAGEHGIVALVEVETPLPMIEQAERLVGGMLRIYRNHLEVIEYGERDTLTGLLNRKTFEDSFTRGLSGRLTCPDRPVAARWLGVLDIDRFKSINDRFGHLIGDEVLVLMARLLRESFRASDRLFRFGGEEFVMLIDRAEADEEMKTFERFRARVAAYSFPQVGNVTVSIGFTAVSPGDTSAAAFSRADEAVYFAKQNGRNQVHAYETLVLGRKIQGRRATAGDIELF